MIADMSLMSIILIGHFSPKKTTREQFKSFQRSLEHKFITFFLSSATKEQLKLEIFFTSWLMLDEASSRKYEQHGVCLPFTHLFIYDNNGNRNCLYILGLYSDHPWSWVLLLSHRAGDVLLLPSPMWRKKPWGRGWFQIRELGDGSANEHCLSYIISA